MTLGFPKPLPGSGKLERKERKRLASVEVRKQEKASDTLSDLQYKAVRFEVFTRDYGRCRAFGARLEFDGTKVEKRAEIHHVVYRSAGGPDTLDNLITLSWRAHKMEHNGLLELEGNPNGAVTFKEYEFRSGTRAFVREWVSLP